MSKVIYKIDPDADTIIVLKNPLGHFTIWNPPDIEELDAGRLIAPEDSCCEEPDPEGLGSFEWLFAEQPPAEEVLVEKTIIDPNEVEHASPPEIQYHVSSDLLKLASPNFERMISGGKWREGIPNNGRYHIPVENWDGEAFLILLNMLHIRTRNIPRWVSLGMLAKIAVLVDYYDCVEAVQPWTEIWIRHLKNTTHIPSRPCRDLMLWMCIAWVLKLPQEFAQTTAVAIKRCRQDELSLSTSDLPITTIVDSIVQARDRAIGNLISQVQCLREGYRSNEYLCPSLDNSFECGSILYGALTKELDTLGLLLPHPTTRNSDASFWDVYSNVSSLRSPFWCTPGPGRLQTQHLCNLNQNVRAVADRVMHKISGLQLKDFGRA